MTVAFVEFVTINPGFLLSGPFLIDRVHGRTKLAVTSEATGDSTVDLRPVAPAREGDQSGFDYYAMVTAVDGAVVALAGSDEDNDPIADQSSGKLVLQGTSELIRVGDGHRVSLIEADVS